MNYANRLQHIAPFQVMELVKRANARQAAGHPVIHMSIGEPDFGAAPAVKQALIDAINQQQQPYTQAVGIAPLRKAISNYYADHFKVDIDPNRIVVTAGASAALTLACAAWVNPGDKVILSDPSYPCNRHFVAAFNGEPQLVATGPETRFQLTRELVEKHWTPQTRGVLLATPSNPTGTSIPANEMQAILAAVEERGGYAMVDEIYLSLSYGQQAARTALEFSQDIIVTNSFSKFFGMTGWRLGWLVVPETMISSIEKLAQNLYICPSTPAQYAALACFTDDSMALFEQRRRTFQERRDYLIPALRAIGFEIPVEPDGAFYLYLDCSRIAPNSSLFADQLLDQANVCLVPGTDFGMNQPERYLRLSYANSMENLKTAVERIAAFVNSSKVA